MRFCTWMLLGLFTVALAGCKQKEPDLPEGTNAEKPEVDTGTPDPTTTSTTGETSTNTNDPESEAPPFDAGGGGDSDTDSDADTDADDAGTGDPPLIDGSSLHPVDKVTNQLARMESPVVDLVAKLSDPSTRDDATDVIQQQGVDAVPQLVSALGDDDWQIRAGAVFALSVLGEEAEDALPRLRDLASTEKHEAVRDAVSWAIDAIENAP